MHRRLTRRPRRWILAGLMSAALSVLAPGIALADTVWFAFMTGDQEVSGPGDPDAIGAARLTLDPGAGQVCVQWDVLLDEAATAAHIHAGAEGVAGAVVLTLPTPDSDGLGGGCVDGLDQAVVQAIVDDPASAYVNVHSSTYPDGALRGQLEAAEVIPNGISVAKAVCPEAIQTPAQLLAAPDGACTLAIRTEDLPEPPAGKVIDPPVLGFDMDIQLDDPGGTLTIDDAELEGGGTCDADSCSYGYGYAWRYAFVGPTTVTELTFPDGYRFGWATIQAAVNDADAPTATVDIENAAISFDTAGFGDSDGFLITLFDFVEVAAPAPTPTGAPFVPTPPPTSTAAGSAGSTASLLPMLAVALAWVVIAAISLRRSRSIG